MNNPNPPKLTQKSTVPAWFMILLTVILIVVVGFLIHRIMTNRENRETVEVRQVEVDPYEALSAEVRELQAQHRRVTELSRDDSKYTEFTAAHKKLYTEVKTFQSETMRKLEGMGIVKVIEDDLGEYRDYQVGFSQYRQLMQTVTQLINDLSRESPMTRGEND